MLHALSRTAPTVDRNLVIITGASELRHTFGPDVLPGVLEAYMVGIKAAFAVSIAFAGTAFLLSWGIPMKRLPTPGKGEKGENGEAPVMMMA